MSVEIKTLEQQEKMRIAGKLASEVLDMIGEHVKPGVKLWNWMKFAMISL
ncbi:MAG: hypothetical protein Ct9H90mP13_04740 [Pseudomonadota bacterium]|nr:MAG: hypothetical protein Ct9H90mP13_04740 [Pseudomonadota bacterium]